MWVAFPFSSFRVSFPLYNHVKREAPFQSRWYWLSKCFIYCHLAGAWTSKWQIINALPETINQKVCLSESCIRFHFNSVCLSLSLSHYIINCHGIGIGIQFQFIHSVDGCWRSQHSARALWLPLHMALSISLQLPIDENQPLMNCIESVLWHATLLCTHKPAVTLSLSQQDQPVLLALETIHGKSLISVSIGFDKCAELVVGWEVPASKQKLHRERQREREREREKSGNFR